MKNSRYLMVQGTTSDAGKSALVAGFCRILARKGCHVAPMKPQNMALNSAVTADGGEIGRAQAVQAQACRIEPSIHMNPVLLKPSSDTGAQVILQGRAISDMEAASYHDYKRVAMDTVMDSFSKLKANYDYILIEGAGSPAEVNLRENDIANMGFAEAADVPVVIVADIDRGGVFAHLYGTLELLSPSEQKRVVGFIINRFRGDLALLQPGLDWLEKKTNKPVLGVIPYIHGLNLEAEDAINAHQQLNNQGKLKVRVPVFTRMSNHTDFDALRLNPDIDFTYVGKGGSLAGADVIILPGTKSVRDDLAYLRSQGWDKEIYRHVRLGGKVIGICGGFQMLGQKILDPLGIESAAGESVGLGLLNMQTQLQPTKQLHNVQGVLSLCGKTVMVDGYEIHAGISHINEQQPIILKGGEQLTERAEGAVDQHQQILGTYLHGFFDNNEAAQLIYQWFGVTEVSELDIKAIQDEAIDKMADAIEQNVDLKKLWPLLF